MPRAKGSSIRALTRGIATLQAINRAGSLSLIGIAREIGVPHPTAIRLVRTLEGEGLVERVPDSKAYRPTALVQSLSCGFQNHDRLVQCAREPIVALTRKCGWPISVVTRAGRVMVTRDSTVSLTSLTFNVYAAGITLPIFSSASGQVTFAYASAEDQQEMLKQASSADRLAVQQFRSGKKAAEIRRQGFAAVPATPHPLNTRANAAIAVPLLADGAVLGALALVFFSSALSLRDAVKKYVPDLTATARQIVERVSES